MTHPTYPIDTPDYHQSKSETGRLSELPDSDTPEQIRMRLLEAFGEPCDRLEYNGLNSTRLTDETMQMIDRHYKAQTEQVLREVIGDGEVHVSHVCPPDSPGCIAFASRGNQRHEQRQRATNLGYKVLESED